MIDRSRRILLVAALALAGCPTAHAQQPLPPALSPEGDLAHYSFATLFGTGIYQLDDRTITIFRIPISWTIREPTPEKFGMKVKVPTAIGFHNFDLFDDLIPTDEQFATLSVVPGLELQYLVGENWRVAPAAYLGLGTDLASSERSVIYGAGASALRPLRTAYPEMHLGTAIIISGYESNKSRGDFLSRWSVGVDAKFPLNWRVAERDVFVGGHVIGYYYMNRLEFQTVVDEPIKVRAELEFGVFFGARPSPKIFGITLDRLGVGYRFSDVSDAIVFFAGFPF